MSKEKTLIVVESPAKAKKISQYLGDDYIVKASYGHMFDLPKKEIGVEIDNNFSPKYLLMEDKKDKLKSIFDGASQSKEILVASDPDREGEAIAWHLAEVLQKSKKPIKRVEFHEITKKEIQKAIKNPRQIDERLFRAQEARRVLDRLVGYIVSPYVIRHFGNNLSAGRVQSVVVRLIVDREKEIENFKPEEYWSIIAHLSKDKDAFYTKYINKISNKEDASSIKNDLEKSSFLIESVERSQKAKSAPPPFITSSLQTTAASKLKFSSSKTMEIAQKLFEAGYITYHRTDSKRIEEDALQACREFLKENNYSIPNKPNFFSDKQESQGAHGCIRPTDVSRTSDELSLSDGEKKLYDLIRARFLACQMSPALFDIATIIVSSSIGKHKLKAIGRILKSKGWLELLDDDEKTDDVKLPIINQGESWNLGKDKVKADQKFTKPPSRYTESTIVKELENRNIGRPATYASHVSKVKDRNYVETKKDIFYPTELGRKVTEDLSEYFNFMKYDYTAEVESKLDLIAEGKYTYLEMLKEFYPLLIKQLKEATFVKKVDYGYRCTKCSSLMELKNGKFGYYLSCINYPDCKFSIQCELGKDGKPIPKTDAEKIIKGISCARCGSNMVKKDGKFGPFYGCTAWPKCTAIQQIPIGKKCSKCQSDMTAKIFDGELKMTCMGYPKCSNIQPIPKNIHVDWQDPTKINKGKIFKKTEKIISRGDKNINW